MARAGSSWASAAGAAAKAQSAHALTIIERIITTSQIWDQAA
jgi:hypothetical protein